MNIKEHYQTAQSDGTIFDKTTPEKGPLQFEVGAGHVIKGFDDAVIGMKEKETKKFKVTSNDAYGDHNPQLIQSVPRVHLPQGQEPAVGMMLILNMPIGEKFPAIITEVTKEEVKIDLNHPLAGKDLNFEITIVGIN